MTLDWLLAWWNLIYVVPFGLGLVYMGLYIATGISFGDGDVDGDLDAEIDGDLEGDVDGDLDGDVEGDIDGDVDGDVEGDGDGGDYKLHFGGDTLLEILGVGRVPLSVVVMTLLMTWGFLGIVINRLLFETLAGWLLPLISIPLAGIGAVTATGVLARIVARIMPLDETSAWRKQELVGTTGEAIYTIDEKFGKAAVRDPQGYRFQVPCRVGVGAEPIAKGQRVLLVEYEEDFYIVRPYELAAAPRHSAEATGEQEPPAAPASVRTPVDESPGRA